MDRMAEYEALMQELDQSPAELEGAVSRARSRCRRSRAGHRWGISLASLGGVAAAFVLLVNCSVPFARAVGNIPFLKDLAAAVAFSPSLKAAVENEFVQPINLSEIQNGITATVEYLIVDQKQVNIFLSLKSDDGLYLWGDPEVRTLTGERLPGCAVSSGSFQEELHRVTVDFLNSDTPDSFVLGYRVQGHAAAQATDPVPAPESSAGQDTPAYLAEFSFPLHFDPAFTDRGIVYTLDQDLVLDGQRITLTDVEVFPTHLRLNLSDHPENTAWLVGLDFYITDEQGNRYDEISNGISASGSEDSPFYPSHRLESTFFADGAHLTIHITGATWLDKDRQRVLVDIPNSAALSPLPQGVELGEVKRRGGDVDIQIFARLGGEDSGLPIASSTYSVSNWEYYDPEGGEHRFERMESTGGFRVDGVYDTPDGIPQGCFSEKFTLEDYPWDTVELGMWFSRFSTFDEPFEIPVS